MCIPGFVIFPNILRMAHLGFISKHAIKSRNGRLFSAKALLQDDNTNFFGKIEVPKLP